MSSIKESLSSGLPSLDGAFKEAYYRVQQYLIRADFESGNLSSARSGGPAGRIVLKARRDCEGSDYVSRHSTWFYFSINGTAPGEVLQLVIGGINKQKTLFGDHRPVFRNVVQGRPGPWQRIRTPCTYIVDEDDPTCGAVRFSHIFDAAEEVYFALCEPWTVSDSRRLVDAIKDRSSAPVETLECSLPGYMWGGKPGFEDLAHAADSLAAAVQYLTSGAGKEQPQPPQPPGVVEGGPRDPESSSSKSQSPGPQTPDPGQIRKDRDRTRGSSAAPGPSEADRDAAPKEPPIILGAPPARRPGHVFSSTSSGSLDGRARSRGAAQTSNLSGSGRLSDANPGTHEVYVRHAVAGTSLEGRALDLLIITSPNGVEVPGKEAIGAELAKKDLRSPLTPLVNALLLGIPTSRPVVFVSARVHPGEAPSSHVMNGMLEMLMREADPRARALRENFIFIAVPLLNPDGVFRGHFRHDTLGQNLNRHYQTPSPKFQPTVFAAKGVLNALKGRLAFYFDLHAHANKRGVFAYGNAHPDESAAAESRLWAQLVAVNSPHFDVRGCNFTERNMRATDKQGESKEGSGRVALFLETGLTHAYTIEASYSCSRFPNLTAPAVIEAGASITANRGGKRAVSPSNMSRTAVNFDAPVLQDVGRAILVSILDIYGLNPASRIRRSEFRSLDKLRGYALEVVRAERDETRVFPKFPRLPIITFDDVPGGQAQPGGAAVAAEGAAGVGAPALAAPIAAAAPPGATRVAGRLLRRMYSENAIIGGPRISDPAGDGAGSDIGEDGAAASASASATSGGQYYVLPATQTAAPGLPKGPDRIPVAQLAPTPPPAPPGPSSSASASASASTRLPPIRANSQRNTSGAPTGRQPRGSRDSDDVPLLYHAAAGLNVRTPNSSSGGISRYGANPVDLSTSSDQGWREGETLDKVVARARLSSSSLPPVPGASADSSPRGRQGNGPSPGSVGSRAARGSPLRMAVLGELSPSGLVTEGVDSRPLPIAGIWPASGRVSGSGTSSNRPSGGGTAGPANGRPSGGGGIVSIGGGRASGSGSLAGGRPSAGAPGGARVSGGGTFVNSTPGRLSQGGTLGAMITGVATGPRASASGRDRASAMDSEPTKTATLVDLPEPPSKGFRRVAANEPKLARPKVVKAASISSIALTRIVKREGV